MLNDLIPPSNIASCCISAAQKLLDPAYVEKIALEKGNQFFGEKISPWEPTTLAYGYPGLIALFSELDARFPQTSWKQAKNQYIDLLFQTVSKQGVFNLSLFSGLAGICFAIHLAAKQSPEHSKLHASLHHSLLQSIKQQMPTQLGVLDGLSGILLYLLNFRDHVETRNVIHDLIRYLIKNCFCALPAIYTLSPGHLPLYDKKSVQEYLQTYHSGCIDTGIAHGIAGVLASLAQATLSGVCIEGQMEAIRDMTVWLKTAQQDVGLIKNVWPKRFALNSLGELSIQSDHYFDGWCYGAPGILNSVLMAASALRDRDLYRYGVDQLAEAAERLHSFDCPSFQYGMAGTLAIMHQAGLATSNQIFLQSCTKLSEWITNRYDENFPFGFKCLPPGDDTSRLIDNPGFLAGSTGVILSLLFSTSQQYRPWLQLYAI